MLFNVGDMLRYHHPLTVDESQLELYHYGKDYLDGKIALVLETSVSATPLASTCDYFCYIDGDRIWISEASLRKIEDEN